MCTLGSVKQPSSLHYASTALPSLEHNACFQKLTTSYESLQRTTANASFAISRFHDVRAFDEIKRSCRERLLHHNKRRRTISDGVDAAKGSGDLSDKGRDTGIRLLRFRACGEWGVDAMVGCTAFSDGQASLSNFSIVRCSTTNFDRQAHIEEPRPRCSTLLRRSESGFRCWLPASWKTSFPCRKGSTLGMQIDCRQRPYWNQSGSSTLITGRREGTTPTR